MISWKYPWAPSAMNDNPRAILESFQLDTFQE